MQNFSVYYCFLMAKKEYLLSTLDYWILLICLALVQDWGKDISGVSWGEEFWELLWLEDGGETAHFGKRCAQVELGVRGNYTN